MFGRGASAACGLSWTVPASWISLPREQCIEKIRHTLREESCASTIDTRAYAQLLDVLGNKTAPGWRHRFLTTNWDQLLEREVDKAYPEECPFSWLESTHVFHLNGTLEESPENPRRSHFLLESDVEGTRIAKLESNLALANMRWADCFVVVGMSFECAMDRSLLAVLGKAELPVEVSTWVVVNPLRSHLNQVCSNLQAKLPHVIVVPVQKDFAGWIEGGLVELQELGILKGH